MYVLPSCKEIKLRESNHTKASACKGALYGKRLFQFFFTSKTFIYLQNRMGIFLAIYIKAVDICHSQTHRKCHFSFQREHKICKNWVAEGTVVLELGQETQILVF